MSLKMRIIEINDCKYDYERKHSIVNFFVFYLNNSVRSKLWGPFLEGLKTIFLVVEKCNPCFVIISITKQPIQMFRLVK